jgi:NAD(P)-dependent dehydrogenase (short-subunit alcohol dehydrogenase family)
MSGFTGPGGLTDFTGKRVLVTGSTGCIGRAIAICFHTAGARVALHYRENEEEARKLAFSLKHQGGDAEPFCGDLVDPEDVELLMDSVVARFGGLDILVNNAGVRSETPVDRISPEEWDRILAADLISVHLMTRSATRVMKGIGRGCIVNIASIEGTAPAPGHAHYAAAKGGLISYTKACAQELGPFGIRVNAVSPGIVHRDGIEKDWPDGVNRWLSAAPLGRLANPEDVGYACLYLASGWASFVTGVNLAVDGGIGTLPGY